MLEPGDTGEPTEAALVDHLATTIVGRQLTVPAVLFLEGTKPLSFLMSQVLFAFEPLFRPWFGGRLSGAAGLLADRGRLEGLIQRIEQLETEARNQRIVERREAEQPKVMEQ